MRLIYNILFLIFFAISAPFYFLKMWRRGNWRGGFGQRFGLYNSKLKQSLTNRNVLWLHAVSVGEVNICTQLIRAIERRAPNLKIVVSTTTSTGMGELRRILPLHIEKIYYPIDASWVVRRALNVLHPIGIVLVEAEVWPNLLWLAANRGVPVFLVNARLSPRSIRGYKRFGFIFKNIFKTFAGVGCQNADDAARLHELGFRPENIHTLGNLKFDSAKLEDRKSLDVPGLFRQIGVKSDAPVLVAGSTHDGEEAILTDLFLRLRKKFPDLFLVLVPRHFERGKEVGRELESRGVNFIYRTNITPETKRASGEIHCLLVNTTGELRFFYEYASLIFVGKSLTAEGGQNPIEPGALGKAMVFGPNMQNFLQIADLLVKRDAAIQVQNAAELETTFARLLADKNRCETLGKNAQQVVRENLGAMERTVEMILNKLPK